MADFVPSHKRIAKNTILLYFRSIFVLIISLFTSRVILKSLGVEDFGIYNVVGGVVAMMSVVSTTLSTAISRFLTFELGKGDSERLNVVFSTSINILFLISLLVFLIGEPFGYWFLNTKLNIPEARMVAANWVFQCSLISFCIGLLCAPYNACIIAHEHMTAYAYMSILQAILKLLICYMLYVSPVDRLIAYVILTVVVAMLMRVINGVYCSRHFSECKYRLLFDKSTFFEMLSFANWNFFTNFAWMLNTQGLSMLINIYFGVTLNAARAIGNQVEGSINQFIYSFTTAINPQITKSYATNQREELFLLICRGARFSFLMVLFCAIPIMIATDYILELWLGVVPDYAATFVRLTLISVMVNIVGNSSYMACMATGKIKQYSLWVTLVGFFVFPLSWIAFALGCSPESTYIIYILVYLGVDITRLIIMRGLLNFPISLFVRDVAVPITVTSLVSLVVPLVLYPYFSNSIISLIGFCILCLISTGISTYYFGVTSQERHIIIKKVLHYLHR